MSWLTNNGTFGTPYGWGNDREQPGHCTSMPRQQNAPMFSNPSRSDLRGMGDSRPESYMAAGYVPSTSSWSNNGFPDPSFSMYREGAWPGDQYLDETRHGSLFGAPGSSTAGSGVNHFLGMEVATPLLEQAIPAASRALPTFQPCPPPSLNWTQAPGLPRQSTSSWDQPMHAARQHSSHSNPIDFLGMRPEVPPFQLATPPVITGHSERGSSQTGRFHPTASPNSVQFSNHNGPVPAAAPTFQSRGERWAPSNAITFQCLWMSRNMQCSALFAGDRSSITSHLRDKHNFTCDGQKIACAWAGCTAEPMQRRNLPRHILTCHLAVKVTCPKCDMELSRADAGKKHLLACGGVRSSAVTEAAEEDEGGDF